MTDTHEHLHSSSRALSIALSGTVAVLVLELIGALVFNSLTLAADAAHLFADATALTVAVVAQRYAARPASSSHSFGWRRAEVLAAQLNGVLLLLASILVIGEALRRFQSPSHVDAAGLILVGAIGICVNLFNTLILRRASTQNMNVRAAALHTISDAVGSLAAVAAGVIIASGGSDRADAIAAILISILVVLAAIRLLRDTVRVLLEATPAGIDPSAVEAALAQDPAVMTVHHLHVWSLAPGDVALSAHVELEGEVTLHQAQAEGARLKKLLVDRFGVGHSTLELECHPCEDDIH